MISVIFVLALWIGQPTNKHAPGDGASKTQIAESGTDSVLMLVALDRKGAAISQGSGFILTPDGLAGTNYHVIQGASSVVASFPDGRTFDLGMIEGADLDKDLVVFQLYSKGTQAKPTDLPHVTLGSSKDAAVGEKVIAIGNPQGLENTVSDGILSAIRDVDSVRYLQITAPISPGSSGGPVLDSTGQMIGVATFQFNKGQNLNFAVAAEHIKPLLDQHFQLSLAEFQSTVGRAQRGQRNTATSEAAETPSPSSQSVTRPLTGQFGGVVHNLSANVSAEFGIVIEDTSGVLSGCMGVKQPLFGSGPLAGFVDGSDVSFIVTSAIGKIAFTGQRSGGAITGTYTVQHEGAPNEEGSFTLRKGNSEGPGSDFDVAQCPTDAEINK